MNTDRTHFLQGLRLLATVCVILVFVLPAASQQITQIVYVENFEDGATDPNVTVKTKGTFTTEPGIRTTTLFGSAKAFGFGKSTATINAWDNYTSAFRIQFPEELTIGLISFKEAELGGNWGSTGYIYVDGHLIQNGIFERTPANDFKADTTFRTRLIAANRIGKIVEFKVKDITSTSEIYIDDILITAYKPRREHVFMEDFNDLSLDPSMSVLKTGTYTVEPGFRSPTLFDGGTAYGFGKSTVSKNAWDSYVTRLAVAFPEPTLIEAISFKEAEKDTNWGGQGTVLIDGHTVANSIFGRLVSNDKGLDSTYRRHYFPVNQRGKQVVLRVSDITSLSEITVDDLQILISEPVGKLHSFEDFEDGALSTGMVQVKKGTFQTDPGIRTITSLGGDKAFGFGKSVCKINCLHDYESSLVWEFPGGAAVDALSFKAMELGKNYGSQAELRINNELWPSADFARFPNNDTKTDSTCRSFYFKLGYPVHKIEWKVWDITDTSEVYIDDITLFGAGSVAVEDGGNAPVQFEVLQNFPNPFNASTVITYTLAQAAPVTVTVYNAQGQVVQTMNRGWQLTGTHQAVFDGSPFASGTYFCEVKTPSSAKTFKMSLLK